MSRLTVSRATRKPRERRTDEWRTSLRRQANPEYDGRRIRSSTIGGMKKDERVQVEYRWGGLKRAPISPRRKKNEE